MLDKCGPNLNCCRSTPVPDGDFARGCDSACSFGFCDVPLDGFQASVSSVALDAFEVTVGRFREFVLDYPRALPRAGEGANPQNPEDSGWDSAWNEGLPETSDDLRASLVSASCGASRTWTDERMDAQGELKPINCVSWYLANAFCIWDGGRLPTHAEWTHAAMGDEQRRYPWSVPPDSTRIDDSFAVFRGNALSPVGTKAAGVGRWGHYDLAGNVAEWVFDAKDACFPTSECRDCGYAEGIERTNMGGSFVDDAVQLETIERGGGFADDQFTTVGIRCARDL